MRYRPRFNSKRREQLWQREKFAAHQAGRGVCPLCNLCGLPVFESDDWDISHHPDRAKVFGGRAVGIAHRLCNHLHGAQVVMPEKAKSDRVRRFHIGASGPGRGRHPMPGGRRDRISKTMRGEVVPRLSSGQKHKRMMAAREIAPAPNEGPSHDHEI